MNTLQLFGLNNIGLGSEATIVDYRVVVVHLEWNFIFLVGKDITLIANDMDRRKIHVIHFCRSRGHFHMNMPCYLPYVPLFIESLAKQ